MVGEWVFEKFEKVDVKYGIPINKREYFISEREISPDIYQKMGQFLDELWAFLDSHEVNIVEDSEQGDVAIHFPNFDLTLVYVNEDHTSAEILDSFPVGRLYKK
jgi:hypothetical protein